MKKAKLGRIFFYLGIALVSLWFVYLFVILAFLFSNLNNINNEPPYWANLSDGAMLPFLLLMIVSLVFFSLGASILGSFIKTSIGKVFAVLKVRSDNHRGIVIYQGVKFPVYSSDELAVGDHVKVIEQQSIPTVRGRAIIYLAKKLDINDPEYNILETEEVNSESTMLQP